MDTPPLFLCFFKIGSQQLPQLHFRFFFIDACKAAQDSQRENTLQGCKGETLAPDPGGILMVELLQSVRIMSNP